MRTGYHRQTPIPGSYIRGGTSKGLFLVMSDLPEAARSDAAVRDKFLARLMGSPDPYAQQIDGLGGATPSTSKVVLVSPTPKAGHDLEYLFGAVAIDRPGIDWSANCGNLTSAVAAFAIERGIVVPPHDGTCTVRMWQANVRQTIVARLQVEDGWPVEDGSFELDGVAFPAAEVELEFLEDPDAGDATSVFPTGSPIDLLEVPGVGSVAASLVVTGAPTVFVRAADFGLSGSESKEELAAQTDAVHALVATRAAAAVRMGLIGSAKDAEGSPHMPRVAYVASPMAYVTSAGRMIAAAEIDVLVRILSLGKLHHAMTGTGAVALAAAAAAPGTVVSQQLRSGCAPRIVFGHPSGVLAVGAEVRPRGDGMLVATRVSMSRSWRTLMRGDVLAPPRS